MTWSETHHDHHLGEKAVSDPMSTAISVSGLVKTFGPTRTLEGLDLRGWRRAAASSPHACWKKPRFTRAAPSNDLARLLANGALVVLLQALGVDLTGASRAAVDSLCAEGDHVNSLLLPIVVTQGRPVTWEVVGQFGATARRIRYRLLPDWERT
jgi:hypothetical protein